MNPTTEAIFSIPAQRLFNRIATEILSRHQVKDFVESIHADPDIPGFVNGLLEELLEIGPLERVGDKYVISGKQPMKSDCQSEATVSEYGEKNNAEQTGKIPESPLRNNKLRSPIKLRSHTKAAERATSRPITGNTSNTNARRNSGDRQSEKTISENGAKNAAEQTGKIPTIPEGFRKTPRTTDWGTFRLIPPTIMKPSAVHIQSLEFMWKKDILIHDQLITFNLDTGAYSNIIPLYLFLDLKLYDIPNSKLRRSNDVFFSFGNFITKIEWELNLLCSTESVKNVNLPFIVVNLPDPPTLGLRGCELLKLVERINSEN